MGQKLAQKLNLRLYKWINISLGYGLDKVSSIIELSLIWISLNHGGILS
ncbi:1477_t:CDS:2 [Acaulospora colombiana]|uniref:1477_t:CDS:1 n=1 Tax=Acaulospora colombiana TaxID=27376 RepID=A0ACA9KWI9_9GLOM|nr:1477_t:CDS:2 [Acaulospora colombiana]